MNTGLAIRIGAIFTIAALLVLAPTAQSQAKLAAEIRGQIDAISAADPMSGGRIRHKLERIDKQDLSGPDRDKAMRDAVNEERAALDKRISDSKALGDFADPKQIAKLEQARTRFIDLTGKLGSSDLRTEYVFRGVRYRDDGNVQLNDGALKDGNFSGFSCPSQFSWEPINVGPNSEVGSAAATREKVADTLGGALGGGGGRTLGGGGGFGLGGNRPGGGSALPRSGGGAPPSSSQDPRLGEDLVPDSAKTTLRDEESGGELTVGGFYKDDLLHFSSSIIKSPYDADGTFQTIFMETAYGTRAAPIRYTLIVLYQDWKLTVSWTYDRYVNGEHVEHREGGWSESGRNILGTWAIPSGEDGLWSELGFGTAQKGAKGLMVDFPIELSYLQKYPVKITTHVTAPNMDPVTTVPFETYLKADENGTVHTMDRGEAINSYLFSKEGWGVGLAADYGTWSTGWDSGFDGYGGSGAYRDLTPQAGIDLSTLRTPMNGGGNSGTGIDTGDAGVKYLSPTIAGFTLGASWEDEDEFGIDPGVALRYAGEFGAIRVAAGLGMDYTQPSTRTTISDFSDSIQMGALSWQRPDYSFDPGIEDKAWDLDADGDFDVGFKADYGLRLGAYYTSPKFAASRYDGTLSSETGKVSYNLGGNYVFYDDTTAPGGQIADPQDYDPPFTFVKGMCLNF